jgi:very-short-patch-repair endonuclease
VRDLGGFEVCRALFTVDSVDDLRAFTAAVPDCMPEMKTEIDPFALLDAHQKSRIAGMRMISVLVGAPSQGRAVFAMWTRNFGNSRTVIVAPEPTYDAAKRALDFAHTETALMIIPSKEELASAAAAAVDIANENRIHPIGVVTDLFSFEALMKDTNVREAVRHAAFGGLVPLQNSAMTRIDALDPSPNPPKPYRSHHEYLLHTLMTHDPAISVTFKANSMVAGASWKKYEVDLWCAEIKFAIEVDGSQHVTSQRQKALDHSRDADLAKAGVKTRRVLASAVMSDPTRTLKLVRDEVVSRVKEIAR